MNCCKNVVVGRMGWWIPIIRIDYVLFLNMHGSPENLALRGSISWFMTNSLFQYIWLSGDLNKNSELGQNDSEDKLHLPLFPGCHFPPVFPLNVAGFFWRAARRWTRRWPRRTPPPRVWTRGRPPCPPRVLKQLPFLPPLGSLSRSAPGVEGTHHILID